MIRIGFRGMLYYTYNKERPTPSSNYKGPLYCVSELSLSFRAGRALFSAGFGLAAADFCAVGCS